jgi:HEAT repeat protein
MSPNLIRLLNKLFNIRPGEWPRLFMLYGMFFVALIGINWGEPLVEAAFLEQVGVHVLPYAFVVNALFAIATLAVYTAFADRIDNTRLLIAILGLSIAGVGVGLALLGWQKDTLAYPLFYFILNVPLLDIFNVHWATYVNSFYDTQAAKRIVPVLGSGARIAGIVAGLTLPLLNRSLSPAGIITIWLAAMAAMAGMAWLMTRLLPPPQPTESPPGQAQPAPTHRQNLRDGVRYVSQSPFLRWLAVSTLLAFTLFPLLNFQALKILKNTLHTTQDISNFIAVLNALGNLLALPIQLLLLNRLIGKIGLGNTSLIFPTGTFAISAGLIAVQNLGTAALAYFNRTTFRTTFRNPIDSLLYNAVPLRMKGRARAFISGLIVPVGSLLGGLLLLIPLTPSTWLLPALIGGLAVAYPLTALITRRQYTQALISMLEQEDFSFLLSQETTNLVAADPATLNLLKQKLQQSDTPEFTMFMAQLICRAGGPNALPILAEAAHTAADPSLRAALLDTVAAAGLSGPATGQCLIRFLADPAPEVRQAALAGLAHVSGPADPGFVAATLPRLADEAPDVRVQALLALARADQFYSLPPAMAELENLLAHPNPTRRAHGVQVLGQLSREAMLRRLLDFLQDPADEVRLAAALALETHAAGPLTPHVADQLRQTASTLQTDPVERIRQAAITLAARLNHRAAPPLLLNALTDPSPVVRETAAAALVAAGKSVIPAVRALLDSPLPPARKMAAVILGRLNPTEYGDLIHTQLTANLLAIYKSYGLAEALAVYGQHRSITVLQSVLHEDSQRLIAEIFYLLAAIHPADDIKIIQDSLANASARVRANAGEALESLTTPQTAQLLAPLLAPIPAADLLLNLSRDTWDMHPPAPPNALRQLAAAPEATWQRAMAVYALGEIGAAAEPPEATKTAEPPPARRRRSPTDLFGALPGDAKKPDPAQIDPPEIEAMLAIARQDPAAEVRQAAQAAQQQLAQKDSLPAGQKDKTMLSTIEKIIFLKEVPFFQGMTIRQLQTLAAICEEQLFETDRHIFDQGDPGGALYVIVSGRVGIEQEKRPGSYARLATLEARSYFGEMTLFDNSPRSATAIALQDTLTLRLRREPLIALARQYPDLSLELINVLSQRLRNANQRIAELTRSHPRQLQKLFDQLE